MLLQDSQERFPQLFKNRYRSNSPLFSWECERNIQPISQCYGGLDSDIIASLSNNTKWIQSQVTKC